MVADPDRRREPPFVDPAIYGGLCDAYAVAYSGKALKAERPSILRGHADITLRKGHMLGL
jgi:hypothetical protein